MNALGQVIRIDGILFDEERNLVYAAPFNFTYDGEGRLLEEHNDAFTRRYEYTPSRITVTDEGASRQIDVYDVVDGRVTVIELGLERPPEERETHEFTYDAAGVLARHKGVNIETVEGQPTRVPFDRRYMFDAQGRVIEVATDAWTRTVTYSETTDQLDVVVLQDGTGLMSWRYTFEPDGRIARFEHRAVTVDYFYAANGIVELDFPETLEAVGTCEGPRVIAAPAPILPFTGFANIPRLNERARTAFNSLLRAP